MAKLSPYDAELVAFLRSELHFSEDAVIKQESSFNENYPIRFDLVVEDRRKTFIIEIKRIVRLTELSQLGFLKHLLAADRIDIDNVEFVIAGKRVTNEAVSAGEKIGIRIIRLPAEAGVTDQEEKPGALPVKITAVKSWQVISRLLMMTPTSIRQLAMASGVWYGWAHATVKSLMEKGIVSDMGGSVKITDITKLLNGVAWERPFERLFFREIRIAADSHIALVQEIGSVCEEHTISCAFTSFTAAELYTHYSARHDSVYLYVEKQKAGTLAGMFDLRNEGGIAVRLYAPDRDVFKDRRTYTVPNVPVVSPSQALLDCAGLGYGAGISR